MRLLMLCIISLFPAQILSQEQAPNLDNLEVKIEALRKEIKELYKIRDGFGFLGENFTQNFVPVFTVLQVVDDQSAIIEDNDLSYWFEGNTQGWVDGKEVTQLLRITEDTKRYTTAIGSTKTIYKSRLPTSRELEELMSKFKDMRTNDDRIGRLMPELCSLRLQAASPAYAKIFDDRRYSHEAIVDGKKKTLMNRAALVAFVREIKRGSFIESEPIHSHAVFRTSNRYFILRYPIEMDEKLQSKIKPLWEEAVKIQEKYFVSPSMANLPPVFVWAKYGGDIVGGFPENKQNYLTRMLPQGGVKLASKTGFEFKHKKGSIILE
ncbi:hypothetical protein N9099_01235 [Mariniblastus sp.]|nr:hypothetical protein [Mariniblastus sp.]